MLVDLFDFQQRALDELRERQKKAQLNNTLASYIFEKVLQ